MDVQKHSLMARPRGDEFPHSRDWGLPSIPCARRDCACNRDGKCEMPSRIDIDGKGVCVGDTTGK